MKTLIDNSQQSTDHGNKPVDDLDAFLAGYKPASSQMTVSEGAKPPVITPSLSKPLENTIQYYKTGKKAGQPKPNKTVQAPVTGNASSPAVSSNPVAQSGTVNSTLITGALFIMLVDLVLPMIIAFVNNQVSKVQIEASSLGLDDKQKKDFEKLADEVVKQFNLQANPAVILAVSMGGIYMMNTVLQRSLAQQKLKVSKPGTFKPEY